jgi:hypothetical protein
MWVYRAVFSRGGLPIFGHTETYQGWQVTESKVTTAGQVYIRPEQLANLHGLDPEKLRQMQLGETRPFDELN